VPNLNAGPRGDAVRGVGGVWRCGCVATAAAVPWSLLRVAPRTEMADGGGG
jgi:hypothetical protein